MPLLLIVALLIALANVSYVALGLLISSRREA